MTPTCQCLFNSAIYAKLYRDGAYETMNPHLILAYRLSRLRARPIEAFFVTAASDRELQRIFQPWESWCSVRKLETGECPAGGVLCLAEDYPDTWWKEETARWRRSSAQVLVANFEGLTEPDHAFLQEIAHHDFEIGGKNEWDGAVVKHSAHTLQLLSETHCRDFFPVTVWPELVRQKEMNGDRLQALDAGCGPVTWLRYGVLQGLLTVTGVDPLLEVYEIVLSRHGLSGLPAIQPETRIPIPLEAFPATAPQLKHQFDFVWTNNALDHTQSPEQAIEAIAFALREDGFAVIQVATNEGTRQKWTQLHKFDFDLHGEHLTATDERHSQVRLVGPRCALSLDTVLHHSVDGLTVIARPIASRRS